MFREFVARKMEAVLEVHVDDLPALTVTKEGMKTLVGELHSTFKIRGLGEMSCYMVSHITRARTKNELKFDQHLYPRMITERFGID